MDVLQKTGTYSGCHSAWSIRPTCQSLKCDIMAPTDITAIDCDLLPIVVQMQFFGHRRLLALRGHITYQCRVTAAGTYWPCNGNMLTRGLASARIKS